MATSEEVLEFWFGAAARDADEVMTNVRRWYAGGEAVDRVIRERFAGDVEAAFAGKLAGWSETPRGLLALVLVLDQFTRGIFRDSPRTYAGDANAQALAAHAFDTGMDRALSHEERHFLVMPFLHSEDAAQQARAVELSQELERNAPDHYKKMAAMGVEQSLKYQAIIQRFGRFPHRNAILGRESTAEELEFLKDWQQKAPPKGMDDAKK